MPLAICATPIGNLGDVTLRVLDELRAADAILCEDTRRTRILLARHGIDARLESHHRHNEAARTPRVPRAAARGRAGRARVGRRPAGRERPWSAADRGCCSRRCGGDRAARAHRLSRPRSSPAASVPIATCSSAISRGGRELRALADELGRGAGAVVAFESPRRLARIAPRARGGRSRTVVPPCVASSRSASRKSCADLLEELAAQFVEAPRGEITLVLGPIATSASAQVEEDARAAVSDLVAAGTSRTGCGRGGRRA